MLVRIVLALGVMSVVGLAVTAPSAHDALDFWRDEWARRAPAMPGAVPPAPPQVDPWGAPPTAITVTPRRDGSQGRRSSSRASGGGRAYCVRTCDGFYVPLDSALGTTEARRACESLCPGTQTAIYRGGDDGPDGIGEATTDGGRRYSALATAFAYRSASAPACGCGARPAGGLAQLRRDPTLVRGDIVVTEAGVHVFTGRGRPPHDVRDFTPYRQARRLPAGLTAYLSEIDRAYANAPARLARIGAGSDRSAASRVEETRSDSRAERRAARRAEREARREARRAEREARRTERRLAAEPARAEQRSIRDESPGAAGPAVDAAQVPPAVEIVPAMTVGRGGPP